MGKEIKSLEELLEEKANKNPSDFRDTPKKTSFFGNMKKAIQENREVKAAIRKAEQERIEKERPIQISLDISDLNEINIIKALKENNTERPVNFKINIGSYKLVYDVVYIYGCQDKNNVEALASKAEAILSSFDKLYGTQHKIERDIKTEEREEERFASAKYDYERYFTTIKYETCVIHAILSVSPAKKEEILNKSNLK